MNKGSILVQHQNKHFYVSKKYLFLVLDQNKNKNIVKIYKEKNCVVCLTPGPDTYFVPCGHLCVHKECHRHQDSRCYLCRKHIANTKSF